MQTLQNRSTGHSRKGCAAYGDGSRRNPCLRLLPLLLSAVLLTGCPQAAPARKKQVRIGITLYDQYDTFLSEMMDSFQKEVSRKRTEEDLEITTDVYNASFSQTTQNSQVEDMIRSGCDVILVNLVDRTSPTQIIDAARNADVPVIFFNRELVPEDLLMWEKLYYVGADAWQSGVMEGELAAALCRDPAAGVDRNGDGLIQYFVLEGEAGHQDAIVRSESSVNTMIEEGVRLEKTGYAIANWNRAQAQTQTAQMIARGSGVELILCNNDDMALGAIDAYENNGTALSDRPRIFGIDGTEVGLQAIENGTLAGTVLNDQRGQAEAMCSLALSLACGESLEGLGLSDGKYIRLPYEKVTADNVGSFRGR